MLSGVSQILELGRTERVEQLVELHLPGVNRYLHIRAGAAYKCTLLSLGIGSASKDGIIIKHPIFTAEQPTGQMAELGRSPLSAFASARR